MAVVRSRAKKFEGLPLRSYFTDLHISFEDELKIFGSKKVLYSRLKHPERITIREVFSISQHVNISPLKVLNRLLTMLPEATEPMPPPEPRKLVFKKKSYAELPLRLLFTKLKFTIEKELAVFGNSFQLHRRMKTPALLELGEIKKILDLANKKTGAVMAELLLKVYEDESRR